MTTVLTDPMPQRITLPSPSLPARQLGSAAPEDHPRWSHAVHEAGHVVAAIVLGEPIDYVHVNQTDRVDGRTGWGFCPTLDVTLTVVWAGPEAELLFTGDADAVYEGEGGDESEALVAINDALIMRDDYDPDEYELQADTDALMDEGRERAAELVAQPDNRRAIDVLARALLAVGHLDGDEATRIVQEALASA